MLVKDARVKYVVVVVVVGQWISLSNTEFKNRHPWLFLEAQVRRRIIPSEKNMN